MFWTPWTRLPPERSVSGDCGGEKGSDQEHTAGKTNSLAGGHLKLAVLISVPPVREFKRFTLQQDLSLLVVRSIDDVINEGAVTGFSIDLLLGHPQGHFVVVRHVLVALGAALVESGANGNNTVIVNGWVANIVSVTSFTLVLVLLVILLKRKRERN
jgi:hypothetical protein